MIRPLNVSSNINFGAKTIEGNFGHKSNAPKRTKTPSDEVRTAFLIGAAVGSFIAAGGVSIYKDSKIDDMLREMAAETAYGVDSLSIENVTDDKTPEIILYGPDGASSVYDLSNGKSYIKMDDELIEIMK